MNNCPKCGMAVEPGWRYCPKDGTDLEAPLKGTVPLIQNKMCPKCGRRYDSRAKFCEKDGATLVGGQPGGQPRIG